MSVSGKMSGLSVSYLRSIYDATIVTNGSTVSVSVSVSVSIEWGASVRQCRGVSVSSVSVNIVSSIGVNTVSISSGLGGLLQ